MKDLTSILELIRTLTSQVFIPIAVTHSPIKPQTDVIVVLRSSQRIDNVILENWFNDNISILVTRLVQKTYKMPTNAELAIRKH